MKILKYPCRCELPSAVALGYFDGVHLAHKEIIGRATAMKSEGLIPTVFTFCDSPGKELTQHLTTIDEKLKLFEALGIEQVVFTEFERIRNLGSAEFVTKILRDTLKAKEVICGYNYRFARNASSDAGELKALCEAQGIGVTVTDQVKKDGKAVSSTVIRSLLREGKLAQANRLLSREYSISGDVVHGRKLGRTIGTPTVNLSVRDGKLLPRFGVYAAYADIGGATYKAIVNIGVKPTVADEERAPNAEAHLLSVSRDMYGEYIKLRLVEFLRDEQKFADIPELKRAIDNDIKSAEKLL